MGTPWDTNKVEVKNPVKFCLSFHHRTCHWLVILLHYQTIVIQQHLRFFSTLLQNLIYFGSCGHWHSYFPLFQHTVLTYHHYEIIFLELKPSNANTFNIAKQKWTEGCFTQYNKKGLFKKTGFLAGFYEFKPWLSLARSIVILRCFRTTAIVWKFPWDKPQPTLIASMLFLQIQLP